MHANPLETVSAVLFQYRGSNIKLESKVLSTEIIFTTSLPTNNQN
jgi:hypothetical protein